MSRVIALAACGLTLAACTSSSDYASWPIVEFWRPAPATAQLRIESLPPGADARTSQGQACRTPCEVTVKAEGAELTVSYALNGYDPQTVPVRVHNTAGQFVLGGDPGSVRLDPNPAYAELQKMRPPKRRIKRKRKPRVSAAPKARPPQATPAQPAPQASSPAPTPAAAYPWPPPPTR